MLMAVMAEGFGCKLIFDAKECVVEKAGLVLWTIPACIGGTYTLNQAVKSSDLLPSVALVGRPSESGADGPVSVITVPLNPGLLWHKRLGHPNHMVFKTMFRHNVLDNLPDLSSSHFKHVELSMCQGCVLGKGKQLPFSDSETVTSDPLELVHADLAGPFSVPGIYQKHYLLVVVDDYTDWCCVLPLRDKSNVGSVWLI